MEIRPYRKIIRKKTKKIKVGNISVGGDSPISVQSKTNTLTTDIKATIKQIDKLQEAGADIATNASQIYGMADIVLKVNAPTIDEINQFLSKKRSEPKECSNTVFFASS